MTVTTIEANEVPQRLAELVSLAASGVEVIVTEDGIPRARLAPLAPRPARVPGLHAGLLQPAGDFDALLPDDFWAGTP